MQVTMLNVISEQAASVSDLYADRQKRVIEESVPCLYGVLIDLILRYLPSSNDWITEWAGERGPEILTVGVALMPVGGF